MKLILVGRVAGAFGVRGEVRITTYTQEPLALARYRDLRREDGSAGLILESARAAKDGITARAKGVDSKEAADALRGLGLYVPREALPATADDDEFYLADLIGLQAHTPDGAAMGVVKAVHDFGAGDILELDPGQGRATLMIPFTRDAVPEVRIGEGRLLVAPPAVDDEATSGGEAR